MRHSLDMTHMPETQQYVMCVMCVKYVMCVMCVET